MKKAYAFVGALLLFSCQGSDPDPGSTFFTLTRIKPGNEPTNSWIVATDNLGNLLDVQPAAGSISLHSTRPVPDSINITILAFSIDGGCLVNTYSGIPKNSTLQESNQLVVPIERESGKATFSINDNSQRPAMVNPLTFSDGYFTLYGKSDPNSHTSSETWNLMQGFDSILVSGYNELIPVYRWFPKVTDGDQINASFSTFSAYPKSMTVDFDGFLNGYVSGLTSDSPFQGGFNFGNLLASRSPAVMGYLEGYSSYSTYISIYQPNPLAVSVETVVYEKTGSINPHLTIPKYDFNLSDTSMNNFKLSFSGDYTYRCVTWTNVWSRAAPTPSVFWRVLTKRGSAIDMLTLANLLNSKFPSLKLPSLHYSGLEFIKLLDGSTYDSFAKGRLANPQQQPAEQITFGYH